MTLPPPRRPDEAPCFIGNSRPSNGLVEIFGEADVLAASKTAVCVKLERLLSCDLTSEALHSDVICAACLN